MRSLIVLLLSAVALAATTAEAQIAGDAARGAEHYRACFFCHSLEAGTHLTGPSLAGLWGRKAGQAERFVRYSRGLRAAALTWDEKTLDAWLADPQAVVPDTSMLFRGIGNERARADLIAFLAIAMAPGGADAVVEKGLMRREHTLGQKPEPLKSASAHAQVTKIRHCRDSYFITTADGVETPYWEKNVRLKLDTQETGPEPGKPVVIGAGMQGDRVSVVFSRLEEIARLIAEGC